MLHLFKGKFLTCITPEFVEKYKAKRKTKVSAATINRELACLKNIFTKAIEWGKVDINPIKKVKLLKEDNVKEKILTNLEMYMLIEAASPNLRPILIIALNTGMRKNEILGLKWKNINFAKGYIEIEAPMSKSGKLRKAPMNHIIYSTLRPIKRVDDIVFYNPKTKNNIKDIQTSFKTACKRVGIDNLRLHDLRHTAATKMIEAGVDLVTVSKILGHSSIQMTMRYAHPTPEDMQKAVDKLGEIFEKTRHKVDTTGNSIEVLKPVISSVISLDIDN